MSISKLPIATSPLVVAGLDRAEVKSTLTSAGKVEKAIKQSYTKLSHLMRHGAPASEIVQIAYWPDAQVTMQGVDGVISGYAELTPVMADSVKEGVGLNCAFALHGTPVVIGQNSINFASSTIKDDATGTVTKLDILALWQKRKGKWKVMREHISLGTTPTPSKC
jgi:ketosteroid isomerase-like protein